MILDKIVAHKKEEVAACKARVAKSEHERALKDAPTVISFHDALSTGNEIRVIAECKKASPSKGVICENYNPAETAKQYEEHGAAAVSCLTDENFFQGSLNDLKKVREAIKIPVLRKEFIIDEYQIFEARAAGADALLLICSILDKAQLHDYVEIIAGLGMDALVEIYALKEVDDAMAHNTGIVGVNNRNLNTFEVDLKHTAEVAEIIEDNALLVSESGIFTREDIEYVASVGAKAILVGEAFMRQDKPGNLLSELSDISVK